MIIPIPRTFGGTLLINITIVQPVIPTIALTAIGRDGKKSAVGRDGKNTAVGRG